MGCRSRAAGSSHDDRSWQRADASERRPIRAPASLLRRPPSPHRYGIARESRADTFGLSPAREREIQARAFGYASPCLTESSRDWRGVDYLDHFDGAVRVPRTWHGTVSPSPHCWSDTSTRVRVPPPLSDSEERTFFPDGLGWNLGGDDDVALQDAICASLRDERKRQDELEAAQRESRLKLESRQRRLLPPGLADTFAPYQWLSDESIAFAYARLASSGGFSGCCGCSSDSYTSDAKTLPEPVLLMDPATAFWLAAQNDARHIREAIDAMRLGDREVVLCPINDNRDGGMADAGTHWTLLVCWDKQPSHMHKVSANGRSEFSSLFGRFSYYDSLEQERSNNLMQAETLVSRFGGGAEISIGRCAKQTNSFDCGVYVLLFSEHVVAAFLAAVDNCRRFRSAPPPWEDRLTTITPTEVTDRRAKLFAAFSGDVAAGGAQWLEE